MSHSDMPTSAPNFAFPGPIGTKRRRMRSGGNVSTLSNNSPTPSEHGGDSTADGASAPPTAKCKATTIPIFLKSKSRHYRHPPRGVPVLLWPDFFYEVALETTLLLRDGRRRRKNLKLGQRGSFPFSVEPAPPLPSHSIYLIPHRNLQDDRHLRSYDCFLVSRKTSSSPATYPSTPHPWSTMSDEPQYRLNAGSDKMSQSLGFLFQEVPWMFCCDPARQFATDGDGIV